MGGIEGPNNAGSKVAQAQAEAAKHKLSSRLEAEKIRMEAANQRGAGRRDYNASLEKSKFEEWTPEKERQSLKAKIDSFKRHIGEFDADDLKAVQLLISETLGKIEQEGKEQAA